MQESTDVTTSNRVRQARLDAGLSQQALATQAGIAIRTLVRIEQGEDVRVSTLASIAGVLGVEASDLVERAAS